MLIGVPNVAVLEMRKDLEIEFPFYPVRIRRRTVDHKVRDSNPAAALMSFGKTLIYICHTPPR